MNIIWITILLSGVAGTIFLMHNFKQKPVIEEEQNLTEDVDLTKEENLGV